MIGGAEVLSYHLLKELNRRHHDILVVAARSSSDPVGHQRFDGLDVIKLDFDAAVASRSLTALRNVSEKVAELVSGFRPDILHINDATMTSFFFRRSGATANLPRVLTLHSPIRPAGKDGLQTRLAADADHIVMVSQAQYAAAAATMPELQSKMSVIRNALPFPEIEPTGLPFAPPILLCIGRLIVEKGLDLVIRAFVRLRKRGIVARLTIAGDGMERSNLERLVRDLGCAEQIEFAGWVMPDRVPSLINTATMVLMPSRWPEPFGLVALQAAQMGRPTIASAIGGLPEVVENGATGLLVELDDEYALADAIRYLLSDPAAARRLGENARRRAREKFDFSALVDAYERVFTDVRGAADRRLHAGDMVA
jgi:glycogen(starch) synthase